jgi:hypothetical protein
MASNKEGETLLPEPFIPPPAHADHTIEDGVLYRDDKVIDLSNQIRFTYYQKPDTIPVEHQCWFQGADGVFTYIDVTDVNVFREIERLCLPYMHPKAHV